MSGGYHTRGYWNKCYDELQASRCERELEVFILANLALEEPGLRFFTRRAIRRTLGLLIEQRGEWYARRILSPDEMFSRAGLLADRVVVKCFRRKLTGPLLERFNALVASTAEAAKRGAPACETMNTETAAPFLASGTVRAREEI